MVQKIIDIASSTRDYNFHSHTQYCDGRAPMELMAGAACMAGMRHYAFTPHSPTDVASPCNMKFADIDPFIRECIRLKEEFADRLTLYSGMEIDYISPTMGPHIPMFAELPLDVRVGSVHFVPDKRGIPVDCDGSYERFARNLHERFGGDIRYVVEKYFSQVREMISRGGFDVLGHLDKIAYNAAQASPGIEEESWYAGLVENVADEAVAAGLAIELNTKHFGAYGRFFPARRWWPLLLEKGVQPIVNSDAHYPEKVTAGRAEAYYMLQLSKFRLPR